MGVLVGDLAARRRWRFLSAKRLEAGRHRQAEQSERLRQRTACFLTDAATEPDGHTRLLSTVLDPSTCFSTTDDAILTRSAIRPSTFQQHERGCDLCIPAALICRHALGACLCLHHSDCPFTPTPTPRPYHTSSTLIPSSGQYGASSPSRPHEGDAPQHPGFVHDRSCIARPPSRHVALHHHGSCGFRSCHSTDGCDNDHNNHRHPPSSPDPPT